MSSVHRRAWLVIVLLSVLATCGGCQLSALTGQAQAKSHAETITVREQVRATSLTVVAAGAADAPAAARLTRLTARPAESLEVVRAGSPPRVVSASVAPASAAVVIPGPPARPHSGASSYQWSSYHRHLTAWRTARAGARREVASRTAAGVRRWIDSQDIGARLAAPRGVAKPAGSLGAECAAGASAMTNRPTPATGVQRVLVLFAASLAGRIPAGELNGDAVLVITRYLPTAADASAAQMRLVRAGAVRATILGPATSAAGLARLVAADEKLTVRTKAFPATALFRTGSSVLLPPARRALRALLPLLLRPGTTAVINGYASTPGTRRQNYLLSAARAAAVAAFFEAHGVEASALTVVGHGPVGPSPRNQRVAVLIEQQ